MFVSFASLNAAFLTVKRAWIEYNFARIFRSWVLSIVLDQELSLETARAHLKWQSARRERILAVKMESFFEHTKALDFTVHNAQWVKDLMIFG